MREFNSNTDREYLEILNEMNKKIEISLDQFLGECILKKERAIKLDNKKVTLLFNMEEDNELSFVKDLSIVISLIEVLRNDKLIFTHINPTTLTRALNEHENKNKDTPDHTRGAIITQDKEIQSKLDKNSSNYGLWELPTTLSNYILEYVGEFFYVRPELTEYINNKFNTAEQLRFKTTLKWTYVATAIALAGLLIAIILPYLTFHFYTK
jgi:hypothetical protein